MSLYDKKYLPLGTYAALPDELTHLKKCVSCGASYRECENIGRHACRIHPGLQLIDSRSNRVFYSCCGYEPGTYGFKENLLALGCLQMDHQSACLVADDMVYRAQQLCSFGLLVMPKVLMPFLTAPIMSSTILYDSEHSTYTDSFRHSFDVLEQITSRYREKRLTSFAYKETRVTLECEQFEPSISWPIEKIQSDLNARSHSSSLFSRLLSPYTAQGQTRNFSRECDAIWSGTRPSRKNEDDVIKQICIAIPFVVIVRIHETLDGIL